MCNRLGKRKFFERYGASRQDLQKKMAYQKDRHGRPLYNNYLPNILNAHGFEMDRLHCPYNSSNDFKRRPCRSFAINRLTNIWLSAYDGKKRRINRKRHYASMV